MCSNVSSMEINYREDDDQSFKKSKKLTDRTLSRHEIGMIVKLRANDLRTGRGAPLVPYTVYDPIRIAQEEVSQGLLQYELVRKIPHGDGFIEEVWDITEMNV